MLGMPAGQDSLQIIKIPSGSAQVSLTDMSRHGALIEQGYRETAKFLADQDFSDNLDREASQIATVPPELTVQVEQEQDKEVTGQTRGAAD